MDEGPSESLAVLEVLLGEHVELTVQPARLVPDTEKKQSAFTHKDFKHRNRVTNHLFKSAVCGQTENKIFSNDLGLKTRKRFDEKYSTSV